MEVAAVTISPKRVEVLGRPSPRPPNFRVSSLCAGQFDRHAAVGLRADCDLAQHGRARNLRGGVQRAVRSGVNDRVLRRLIVFAPMITWLSYVHDVPTAELGLQGVERLIPVDDLAIVLGPGLCGCCYPVPPQRVGEPGSNRR